MTTLPQPLYAKTVFYEDELHPVSCSWQTSKDCTGHGFTGTHRNGDTVYVSEAIDQVPAGWEMVCESCWTTCPDCKAVRQGNQFCRFCQQDFGPNTNRPVAT